MTTVESDTLWIHVRNWERFQHYADRRPTWIKNYVELLHDPAYLSLSFHQRGVLHGIWMLYAASRRQIPLSTSTVTRQLGERVTTPTLDALIQAGFIRVGASEPLALRARSREEEKRETPPNPPENGGALRSISRKELRRFTGCKATRGTHGTGWVRDPLGTDRPPADWPHEPPSEAEVLAAMNGSVHAEA